jgi:hypothetical protein
MLTRSINLAVWATAEALRVQLGNLEETIWQLHLMSLDSTINMAAVAEPWIRFRT